MRFDLRSGGVLIAEGTIDLGAGSRFAEEIEARGEYVRTVSFNSPGGSVDDALAMSKLIREKKLDTKVASKALLRVLLPDRFCRGCRAMLAEKDATDSAVHQVFSGGEERPTPAQAMSFAQSTHCQSRPPSRYDGSRPRPLDQCLSKHRRTLYYLTKRRWLISSDHGAGRDSRRRVRCSGFRAEMCNILKAFHFFIETLKASRLVHLSHPYRLC